MVKISIIVPVHNERKILEKSVKKISGKIREITGDYEIILAEDGSTDGTHELARALSKKDRKIVHLHSDQRLGKGRAVTSAIGVSKGDIIVMMDIDLSARLGYLKQLIKAVQDGADVSIGSRLIKGSHVKRSFLRSIASRIYNLLVRLFFGLSVLDHQCGFKAFKKISTRRILREVTSKGWFWDTELLVRAQRGGCKIVELPIEWEECRTSKIKLMSDSLMMTRALLKLWLELRLEE